MIRLEALLRDAFRSAGGAFAPLYLAFGWVHRWPTSSVRRASRDDGPGQLSGLWGAMTAHRDRVGSLGAAVDPFVTAIRSDGPGLFACYDVAGVPRTNNDRERVREPPVPRAPGRKGASPALVLRGAAKWVTGLATRHREVTAADLASTDRVVRERLRAELEARREQRVERRRFRRGPDAYLKALGNKHI